MRLAYLPARTLWKLRSWDGTRLARMGRRAVSARRHAGKTDVFVELKSPGWEANSRRRSVQQEAAQPEV